MERVEVALALVESSALNLGRLGEDEPTLASGRSVSDGFQEAVEVLLDAHDLMSTVRKSVLGYDVARDLHEELVLPDADDAGSGGVLSPRLIGAVRRG